MSAGGADSHAEPDSPAAQDEPAMTRDQEQETSPAPFDPARWGAVTLGILVGLVVALAFLAAASSSF